MIPSPIEYAALVLSVATVGVYLFRCKATTTKPTLATAVICACSGSAVVYGGVLIATPFVPVLQAVPMQPLHQIIAGIALAWVGADFLRGLWIKPSVIAGPEEQLGAPTATDSQTPRLPEPVPIVNASKNDRQTGSM